MSWESPDGIYLGREQPPSTPTFASYIFRPRWQVEGTLTFEGKTTAVGGHGYQDHAWYPRALYEIMHHWHWSRCSPGTTRSSFGRRYWMRRWTIRAGSGSGSGRAMSWSNTGTMGHLREARSLRKGS